MTKLKHAVQTSDDAEMRMRAGSVITRLNRIRWQTAQHIVDSSFADFPYIDALWYNVQTVGVP